MERSLINELTVKTKSKYITITYAHFLTLPVVLTSLGYRGSITLETLVQLPIAVIQL